MSNTNRANPTENSKTPNFFEAKNAEKPMSNKVSEPNHFQSQNSENQDSTSENQQLKKEIEYLKKREQELVDRLQEYSLRESTIN